MYILIRSLAIFALFFITSPALAAAECAELTTLQQVAGYLSWLNFFKGLGAVIISAGFFFLFWGILVKVIYQSRVLLEVLAYVASLSLIASGWWLDTEYLTWTVVVGCIMFAVTVMATLWIHNIEGDDPKPLAAFFMLVWGAVAIFYNMSEVGILAILALVTVLGFSVVVTHVSYAFGFDDDKIIPSSTAAAMFVLVAFLIVEIAVPDAPIALTVFKPGAFWVSSFVAFLGLLIMSSSFYSRENYLVMQLITIVLLVGAVAVGMIFGINPLAGTAGTFLVFYLAAKPLEIPEKNSVTVGLMLIASGGIMFGAWYFAMQNIDVVEKYFTMTF